MVKKLFFLSFILSLMITSLFAIEPINNNRDNVQVKEKAINFTLKNLQGSEVSLTDFKDKSVLLFFWTTWCPFCRQELNEINNKYEGLGKCGVQVLPIDTGESSRRVENFLITKGFVFSVLLDQDAQVAYSYDVLGVPTYILINKNDEIVFRGHSFPQDYKNLISQ